MKRTLIALAVLATASSAALAQSSVTVYGRLNTTIERQKNIGDTDSQTVMENVASRIGFKGTEDLGGGLKGLFLLEHRFNSDTGTVTRDFWAGDAYVGVQSNLGTVRLGRITSPAYYATADYVSLHNHDTGTSADAFYIGASQPTNTVAYLTPSFGGLTAEVAYSFGENGATVDDVEFGRADAKSFNLALNYDNGPLHLGAGYDQNSGPDDLKQLAVRALYELGAFTIGGYYQRVEADDADRDSVRAAVMYTMGANEFHVNVGWADDVDGNDGAVQYTLGYNYNLSKRTKVYAFYTKIKNDSGAAYGIPATSDVPAGRDPSSIAIGVRHNF